MPDIKINFDFEKLPEIMKMVNELKTTASKISIGTEADVTMLKEVTAELKKQKAVKEGLTKVKNEESTANTKLNTEQKTYADLLKQIEKEEAKLKTAMSEKAVELERLRQATQKQNAINKETIKLAENEAGSINDLRAKIAQLTKERNSLGDATGKNKVKITELNKELDKHNKVLDSVSDKTLLQKRNIGNYKSALEGLPGPLGNAASSVGRLGKAFMALLTNPIALTIVAIAGAVYSLGKAFLNTEAGADKYEKVMQQLKSSWSVYLQFVSQIGKYDGDVLKHFKDANNAAKAYADSMDQLNDSQINNLVYEQRLKTRLAEIKLLYVDTNKTIDEKIGLAEEGIQIYDKLAKIETDRAKTAYQSRLDLMAGEFKINAKTLDHYVKANDETNKLMLLSDKTFADGINRMGMDEVKNLKELFNKKDEITESSYKERKKVVGSYNSFVKEKNDEELKSEKAKNALIKAQTLSSKTGENTKSGFGKVMDEVKKEQDAKLQSSQVIIDANIQAVATSVEVAKIGADREVEIQREKNEKIKELERRKEEEKKMLIQGSFDLGFALLDLQGAINTAAMNKELAAAEGNEAKQAEIKKKYGKKQQALQVGQALMNGALAITNILANVPAGPLNPAAWIAIALSAATTGAQIATIKAQKFAKGGEIDGRLHSQGGTIIEAEKGEYVINRKSTGKYRGLIEGINQDDQMKIMMSLNMDKRVNAGREQDKYTKLLYEHLSQQEVGYETPEFYVIRKGTKTTKLKKHNV